MYTHWCKCFFILNEYKDLFQNLDIEELWLPPNYEFTKVRQGSTSTLKNLNDKN